jgi:hypothetical protein
MHPGSLFLGFSLFEFSCSSNTMYLPVPLENGSIERVVEGLKGIKSRKWNSERFLVLQVVILQRSQDVKRSRDVGRRIAKRLDAWEKGQFTMLVEDILRSMEAHLTHKQGSTTPEQRTKTFHQKVLRSNLRGAVRYLTEREKGGILYPDDIDEKSGNTVQSVLESKHPMLGFQESMFSPTTPSSPTSLTSTSPRIPLKSQPAAYPEALGWEGRMPTRYSNGCCALGNQVGFYDKPPPSWLTGSPTPSPHGPPTGPSWPAA